MYRLAQITIIFIPFFTAIALAQQPQFVGVPDSTTTLEDESYSEELFIVNGADTVFLIIGPPGMVVEDSLLASEWKVFLEWIPENEYVDDHIISVVADNGGLTDTATYVLTVINVNDSCSFLTDTLLYAYEDNSYQDTIYVREIDIGDTVSFSLLDNPEWLSMVNLDSTSGDSGSGDSGGDTVTAVLFGTPTINDVGDSIPVRIQVMDTAGVSVTRDFYLAIMAVNDAPIITTTPQDTIWEDQLYSQFIDATDEEGDTLNFSLLIKPTGMTIDSIHTTRSRIRWTPDNDDVGDTLVSVQASDGKGGLDTLTYVLHVINVNGLPIVILDDLPIEQSGEIEIPFTLTDEEGNNLSLLCEYQIGGWQTWIETSVAGTPTSGIDTTTLDSTMFWNTSDIFPNEDQNNVIFRVTPSDSLGEGTSDQVVFHIDNYHNQTVNLTDLSDEQSGDVIIEYELSDNTNDLLDLICQYRRTTGPYQFASIMGDTDGLGVERYSGEITWESLDDADSIQETLTFRVIPSDGWANGIADSITFTLDNYHLQSVTIDPLPESSDTVEINFTLVDPTGDPLSIHCEYSHPTFGWRLATVVGDTANIDSTHYRRNIRWASTSDLSNDDLDSAQFRIIPNDGWAYGDTDTVIFHLDNYHQQSVNIIPITVEQSDSVTISFTLTDIVSYDTLNILCQFWDSDDGEWETATIVGDTSRSPDSLFWGIMEGLDSSYYASADDTLRVIWASLEDLPGVDQDIQFRITPNDGWKDGTADVETFRLLNDNIPTVSLSSIAAEQSDTVWIHFELDDLDGEVLSIRCQYWNPDSSGWFLASIIEDTAGFNQTHYLDSVRWNSRADLPDFSSDSTKFRIFPNDTHTYGEPDTIIIALDNYHLHAVDVQDIPTEQSGDVTITYTLTDATLDTLNISCQYSTDGIIWPTASVTGQTSAINNYASRTIVWNSAQDLSLEQNNIQFKIIPNDTWAAGTEDAITLHVDNFHDQSCSLYSVPPEVSGDITFSYQLADSFGDTLDLICQYFYGGSWRPATVEGDTANITYAGYPGSVTWLSDSNLTEVDQDVKFRIIPDDDWALGLADSVTFHLDNRHPQEVEITNKGALSAAEQSDTITIDYALNDISYDTLNILCQFWDPDSGRWESATVIGDTAGLLSSPSYYDSIVWISEADLHETDRTGWQFRIIPSDTWMDGDPDSVSFHLDNNDPPVINLSYQQVEDTGRIAILYQVSDEGDDPVTLHPRYWSYSTNQWAVASVIGDTSDIPEFIYNSDSILWNSLSDISGEDSVRFAVWTSDADTGSSDTTLFFWVDNYHGQSASITNKDSLRASEQFDSVTFSFTLTDSTNDTLNLLCRYSVDDGVNWYSANLTAASDTLDLQVSGGSYSNSVVWVTSSETEVDLSAWDDSVSFKIIPSDTWADGTPDSVKFKLDNNAKPSIQLIFPFDLSEKSGDFYVSYVLSDLENDTLSITCEFSTDGMVSWGDATISEGDTSGILSSAYTDSIQWDSDNANDVGTNDKEVYFRVTVSDHDTGGNNTLHFYVDNCHSQLVEITNKTMLMGSEQSDSVTISFTLTDSTNDTLNLHCLYSVDDGENWYPADLTSDSDTLALQVSGSSYSNSVIWVTSSETEVDLSVWEDSVTFKIIPSDTWADGAPDLVKFKLDNNAFPVANISDPTGEKHDTVHFTFTATDLEGDSVSYAFLFSVDGGANWDSATVSLETGGRNKISKKSGKTNYSEFLRIDHKNDGRMEEWKNGRMEERMDGTINLATFPIRVLKQPSIIPWQPPGEAPSSIRELPGLTHVVRVYSTTADTVTLDGTWYSLSDTTDFEGENVRLKVVPFDFDQGQADSTNPFHLDNFQGHSISLDTIPDDQSDSVRIGFLLSDGFDDMLTIRCSYSPDNGGNWEPATVVWGGQEYPGGIIQGLGNSVYDSSLIWVSRTDLDSVDLDSVWFRIVPSDGWADGVGDTVIFHLDNNDTPSIDVAEPAGEVSGDVWVGYQLSDAEGDTLRIRCWFSTDGIWNLATVTGDTSGLPPQDYADSLIWNSEADLALGDWETVWFKIGVFDHDPGLADSTPPFRLDNYHNQTIDLEGITAEVTDSVTIVFRLTDATQDTSNLTCLFATDPGGIWNPATVIGQLTGVNGSPSPGTQGSLIWASRTDLPGGDYENLQFKIIPDDSWKDGVADSIDLHLDNDLPPSVDTVYVEAEGEQWGDVGIRYHVLDFGDDLTLSYTYWFSIDGGVSWDSAHVDLASVSLFKQGNPFQNDIFMQKNFYKRRERFTTLRPYQGKGLRLYSIQDLDSTFSLTWYSEIDLPDTVLTGILFKVEVSDADSGTPGVSLPFRLDNDHGGVVLDSVSGVQRKDASISYQLFEDGGDTLDLFCQFWNPPTGGWDTASVSGAVSRIDSSHYSGTLTWHSFQDLPDVLWSQMFRVTPRDEWTDGIADTLIFTVDNRPAPVVLDTSLSPGENESAFFNTTLQIFFDHPMDTSDFEGKVEVVGSVTGNHDGTLSWGNNLKQLSFTPTSFFAADEVVSVTLKGDIADTAGVLLDGDGDGDPQGTPTDDYSWNFYIGLLGDYNLDDRIDFVDLTDYFLPAWEDTILSREIGPVTGSLPHWVPQFDGRFDFEDLMVFSIMWGYANRDTGAATFLISNDDAESDEEGKLSVSFQVNEFLNLFLNISPAQGVRGIQAIVHYDPLQLKFVNSEPGEIFVFDEIKPLYLTRVNREEGLIEVISAPLASGEVEGGVWSILNFLELKEGEHEIGVDYVIKTNDGRSIAGMLTQMVGGPNVPETYFLSQNYPNPFNPSTTFDYGLPEEGFVTLKIFNVLGQEVATLVNRRQLAGYYRVSWNAARMASGIYFARLKSGDFVEMHKLVVLK